MKILIVDDELKARRLLKNLLEQQYNEEYELLNAQDLPTAVELINEHAPDIVLLDIKMPGHSGLDILSFFKGKKVDFQIIFTTAYNEYAVEAFKLSAVDYLLKPIDPDELYAAIDKAKTIIESSSVDNKLDDLQKAFVNLSINKIALEVPKGFMFVSHDDVILFEADGMYTRVHLKGKSSELICKPLKHFSEQLEDNALFYKPHRSFLVNLKYISEVKRNDGLYMILENGKTVTISRDKRDDFLRIIQEIF